MLKLATFAAGCFWGVEELFLSSGKVLGTKVGYMGGTLNNPTYSDVCSGRTGHAEVVQVEYESTKTHYTDLLNLFWSSHDPTTVNRQGPDIGTQYRSAIFYHDPEQYRLAKESKEAAQLKISRPIVTQIVPSVTFFPAEEYHQQYMRKHGGSSPGCQRPW